MTNNFGARVSVIEIKPADFGTPTFHTITNTIEVGNGVNGIGFNPITRKMYTANIGDSTVSVINVDTGDVTKTIPVGIDPFDVGVDSFNNLIFISNRADGTLTVIDGSSDTVVNLIPTDISTPTPRPKGVDVNADNGNIL